jgi:hypothetical protein
METPDAKDSEGKLRTLELSSREVHLLLKYGYPFPEAERPLRESRAIKGIHHVRIDAYWLEMMLGDLCRSVREQSSRALVEELDALCDELERALDDRPTIRIGDFE